MLGSSPTSPIPFPHPSLTVSRTRELAVRDSSDHGPNLHAPSPVVCCHWRCFWSRTASFAPPSRLHSKKARSLSESERGPNIDSSRFGTQLRWIIYYPWATALTCPAFCFFVPYRDWVSLDRGYSSRRPADRDLEHELWLAQLAGVPCGSIPSIDRSGG